MISFNWDFLKQYFLRFQGLEFQSCDDNCRVILKSILVNIVNGWNFPTHHILNSNKFQSHVDGIKTEKLSLEAG